MAIKLLDDIMAALPAQRRARIEGRAMELASHSTSSVIRRGSITFCTHPCDAHLFGCNAKGHDGAT